jgi:hypothetical protein
MVGLSPDRVPGLPCTNTWPLPAAKLGQEFTPAILQLILCPPAAPVNEKAPGSASTQPAHARRGSPM